MCFRIHDSKNVCSYENTLAKHTNQACSYRRCPWKVKLACTITFGGHETYLITWVSRSKILLGRQNHAKFFTCGGFPCAPPAVTYMIIVPAPFLLDQKVPQIQYLEGQLDATFIQEFKFRLEFRNEVTVVISTYD